jgi:hypothetical protein
MKTLILSILLALPAFAVNKNLYWVQAVLNPCKCDYTVKIMFTGDKVDSITEPHFSDLRLFPQYLNWEIGTTIKPLPHDTITVYRIDTVIVRDTVR